MPRRQGPRRGPKTPRLRGSLESRVAHPRRVEELRFAGGGVISGIGGIGGIGGITGGGSVA